MEATYQLENQNPPTAPHPMEESQGLYLDSRGLKEYPNYLCNRTES